MMHLTTISPPALISIHQKEKGTSGKWKASYEQKFEVSHHEKVKALE